MSLYSPSVTYQSHLQLNKVSNRILIVEDDAALAEVLTYNLEKAGFDVSVARNGRDGLEQAQLRTPDVVLLDLMLPLVDGMEVCRRLRSDSVTSNVLILMVSAKAEETDQIVGFSMGADDYVTKPFSPKVLIERIKALLRRRDSDSDDHDVIACQGITIDRRRHRVNADDKAVELTPSEFALLETMMRQPGRAFSRSELILTALGDDAIVLERTIDVHIRALRRKLENRAELIETVRGVGYRFRESD